MELNLNIETHNLAIARYVTNEMEAQERKEFEQIIYSNPNNIQLIQQVKDQWEQSKFAHVQPPNLNSAWEKVTSKMELDPNHGRAPKAPNLFVQWGRVAASITIIVTLSLLTLFYHSRTSKISITSHEPNTVLAHTLPDGTIAFVAEDSEITYKKSFGKTHRTLLSHGKVQFDVSKDHNHPFIVKTLGANVKVLGTNFSIISRSTSQAAIEVNSGSLSVSTNATESKEMIINAGERVEIHGNEIIKSHHQHHSQPKTVKLQFIDEPLQSIINTINRTYKTNIQVNTASRNNQRMTVTFENDTVPYMVNIISQTLRLHVIESDTLIILTE